MYAYTRTPRIYSSAEHFAIESYVRPVAVAPLPVPSAETLFVFPFDHDTGARRDRGAGDKRGPDRAPARWCCCSCGISARLRTGGAGLAGSVISRSVAEGGWQRRVTVSHRPGRRNEEWLVWRSSGRGSRGFRGAQVEIAFRLEGGRIAGLPDSPLTVFFPTEKETFLGFLIQGPYRTTPARDNIPGHDPSNQALVRSTASLLADVLRSLRDEGLLTVAALQALPLDSTRFEPGSMFRPLFDSVGEALTTEALIPVAGGGYGVAVDLELAGRAEVHELLDPDQLGALCGAGLPVWFADQSVTEHLTPVLWRYLREEIGIDEVTPADVVSRVTREFLGAQSDEWITRFYAFLFGDSVLWRAPRFDDEEPGPARAKPIIRLEDGRHVAPFDDRDRPAVYLPGPVASSLPTVRRAVADSPGVRQFLEALGLGEPDVVAEVLQVILPSYDDLDVAELDPARHAADLECVVRALDGAAPSTAGRREELIERLGRTPFLIGENAATGEQRLMPPPGLYQRSKDLEVYFDGNPDIWFAGDRYGPWLVQLREMGVRQAVEVRARTPGDLGYVPIAVEFGRNERGLGGFDPDAEIDGLDFALRHPSHARSEYVWNVLLAPNRRLWPAWWNVQCWRRSATPARRMPGRRSRQSRSARPGCPGGTGPSCGRASSPSTTCHRRTRGRKGWPTR